MKFNIVYLMIFLGFFVSVLVYPNLPSEIVTHWNVKGVADGFSSKEFGLFIIPVMSLAMYILMKIIPKIDPLKKNFESFQKDYETFIAQIIAFLLYLHVITLAWNMGFPIDVLKLVIPGIAVIFWQVSNLMEHSKRTWFVGFRTPWTLSSDRVWNKTNKLAAKYFRGFAVFMLIFILSPENLLWFMLPLFVMIIYLVYFSYKEFTSGKG